MSTHTAGATGSDGPVVVEIEGVTAPAVFNRLPDAVTAVWQSMRALPLGNLQYEAYKLFFTQPDAVEHVGGFLRRDGELHLSFAMDGRNHSLRIRPVTRGGTGAIR